MLTDQAHEIRTAPPAAVDGLVGGRLLRVAAATLRHAPDGDISTTTVVGTIGADDLPALQASVAIIAAEFDLDARLRTQVGAFAVRFSRR
jgi:hypothetical protein